MTRFSLAQKEAHNRIAEAIFSERVIRRERVGLDHVGHTPTPRRRIISREMGGAARVSLEKQLERQSTGLMQVKAEDPEGFDVFLEALDEEAHEAALAEGRGVSGTGIPARCLAGGRIRFGLRQDVTSGDRQHHPRGEFYKITLGGAEYTFRLVMAFKEGAVRVLNGEDFPDASDKALEELGKWAGRDWESVPGKSPPKDFLVWKPHSDFGNG